MASSSCISSKSDPSMASSSCISSKSFESDYPIDIEANVENMPPHQVRQLILKIRSVLNSKNIHGLPVTNTKTIDSHMKLKTNTRQVILRTRLDSAYLTRLVRDDNWCFVFALKKGDPPRKIDSNTKVLDFNERYARMVEQAKLKSLQELFLYPGMLKDAVNNLFLSHKDPKFAYAYLILIVGLLETARQDPVLEDFIARCSIPGPLGLLCAQRIHASIPGPLGLLCAQRIHAWGDSSRYHNYSFRKYALVLENAKTPNKIKSRIKKIEKQMGILKSTSRGNVKDFLERFEREINDPDKPLFFFFKHEDSEDHEELDLVEEARFEAERVNEGTLYKQEQQRVSFWVIVRNLSPTDSREDVYLCLENFGKLLCLAGEQSKSYAFVQFEHFEGFRNALQASPIVLFGKRLYIEERRTPRYGGKMESTTGKGSQLKPCTKFFSASGCSFGDRCHFLHHAPGGNKAVTQILGNNPALPIVPRNPPPPCQDGSSPFMKPRICNTLKTAKGCKFGDNCNFAHGEWELVKPTVPHHEDPRAKGQKQKEIQGSSFVGGARLEPAPPNLGMAAASFGASSSGKISVDTSVCGAVIGKGGVNSKQIRHMPGAKLSVRDHENIREALGPHVKSHGGGGFKTMLCQGFIRGFCTYGYRCYFAHGEGELRKSGL